MSEEERTERRPGAIRVVHVDDERFRAHLQAVAEEHGIVVDDERSLLVVAASGRNGFALLRDPSEEPDVVAMMFHGLSCRELQVLKLIANGKENAEIAEVLVISPKTVKNHISSILAKLRVQNRIQAAVYAVRSGIV